MKNILKNAEHAEKLLKLTSDTMILLDKDGICVDIAVYDVDLWFLKEERLKGKNLLLLIPPTTYELVYPEFMAVLTKQVRSEKNYELTLGSTTYFFKCIMYPYEDMVLCQYRDITKRSQRKLELEKKNYELNEIQKAALIGKWRYSSSTQTFGYIGHTGVMCAESEQQIMLNDYISHIILDDQVIFSKWLEQNLDGNIEEIIDYRIHFQNQVFYIRLKTFERELLADGSITLEGYIQNITDIQRRRNDINLLTHAINNSSEDIFAVHENGTLVFANRRFMQHHDISNTDNLSLLKIYDINPNIENAEKWKKMIATIQNGEEHNRFIMKNPMPLHPEILVIEGNAYWVTSDEGEKTLWAFGHDITQRIKHEQQIKQFSQILDKIIENLPASIVVKDINDGFKYLYRNRESYNRSISIKEVLGKDDFDFYPLEIAQEKREQDIRIAETGQEIHCMLEERNLNGESIYLDKRKMKIDSKDFPPIILSIEWDITDMEQMKRELLIAKEKAETSDQLKSAFLANMSHEIRTPLNAIVGFSRIIAESTDPDERNSYYEIVDANNERLLKLINEILDLSKIEAGMVEFTITPVRLHPLCKEIHDALRFRCPIGVELIYEPSDEEVIVEGDKNRIFQVISNIIGNAFKFTTSGSVSYGYRYKENFIEFYIRDTGIGIEANKLEKIFERFVKVNSFAQGTGLGLSICKTIIERLGGHISASSEMGCGTTFTFTLPVISKKEGNSKKEQTSTIQTVEIEPLENEQEVLSEADDDNKPISASNKDKKTILVAEDTDCNYILIKAILGNSYHLEHAKDGMVAVTMFEEINPDLILMDMKMPNLGGLDATKIIRELSPEVPIIALTAYAYEQDKQAALEAGCSNFLTKPFNQEALKDMIKLYLP